VPSVVFASPFLAKSVMEESAEPTLDFARLIGRSFVKSLNSSSGHAQLTLPQVVPLCLRWDQPTDDKDKKLAASESYTTLPKRCQGA